MPESMKRRGMGGKDVITVGIFSAIYFVINFAFMLLGGLHPLLWILMPGFIALFTGIPYLMMCAKVQKVGSVLLMGLITGLIYYVTGQFTMEIWSIRSARRTSRTSLPRTSTFPEPTSQNRARRFATVDFPPPEGPTSAAMVCCGRVKEMLWSTSFSP